VFVSAARLATNLNFAGGQTDCAKSSLSTTLPRVALGIMHRHLLHSKPSWHGGRPFTARQQSRRLRPRSEGSAGDNGSAKDAFTEDVLARLRKAEAEAAALREQLQTATVATPVCAAQSCSAKPLPVALHLQAHCRRARQCCKLTLLLLCRMTVAGNSRAGAGPVSMAQRYAARRCSPAVSRTTLLHLCMHARHGDPGQTKPHAEAALARCRGRAGQLAERSRLPGACRAQRGSRDRGRHGGGAGGCAGERSTVRVASLSLSARMASYSLS